MLPSNIKRPVHQGKLLIKQRGSLLNRKEKSLPFIHLTKATDINIHFSKIETQADREHFNMCSASLATGDIQI